MSISSEVVSREFGRLVLNVDAMSSYSGVGFSRFAYHCNDYSLDVGFPNGKRWWQQHGGCVNRDVHYNINILQILIDLHFKNKRFKG